jgi:hypothetical protein
MKKLIPVAAVAATTMALCVAGATAEAPAGGPGAGHGHQGRGPVVRAAVHACKAERSELGREAFGEKYGRPAFRNCAHQALPEARNAAQECRAEREETGVDAFREKYGSNENGRNAFGKCVSGKTASDVGDDEETTEPPATA